MSNRIPVVNGDSYPNVTLTLTKRSGGVLDVSGATVRVYLREPGSTTILSTRICSNVTDGTDGRVVFNFEDQPLDAPTGTLEGEVEVDYGGGKTHTVFEPLRFRVRDEFA